MKMNKYILALFGLLMVTLSSCEKPFDQLEIDSNKPVHVPASLVFQGVAYSMFNDNGRPFSAEMRWNQFYCSNYNYYANNEYTFGQMPNQFTTLKNVVKMEEEAKRAGLADVNGYAALGKFFRAYFYDQMSKRVGDLPLTEALKGIEGVSPKYDSQKAIYIQILKWLDDANTDLTSLIAKGETVSGDIYYNGDLKKWQKAVNAYRLRVLVTLSKKDTDAELGVKAKFAEMISNPTKYPMMTSMADNLEFKWNNFNKYPSNPDNFGFDATRQNMAAAYVNLLSGLKDPRVMVTCEPAGFELKSGKLPSDYSAFLGASSAEDLADMSDKAGINNGAGFAPGKYSFQNRNRYYKNYTAENTFIVGYPELCFNMAEGIARGWATGSAEDWYKKGIQASQAFYGVKDGVNTMTYSRTGSMAAADQVNYTIDFSFADYYAQAGVKYDASKAIQQIVSQKYLAFFMNSGMEAYFNWRRTGFPKFDVGVGNGNSNRIAVRWIYPTTERTTNATNYKAAIQSQFNGTDDINDLMWLIK
ncbi:SusD/RagB family nutrient-binding outer membrane lipoprotein [Aquirufa ecclesiirivi]|uniref:SusD/RagB family nutrient-binding outer membrane lipoprotein n=2 Tax=Aquirufa ecclesiirivi TaxID=2715124 RepID=UPI00140C8112|nr:SusD/RagB family nutrient-binding outer membrane lipoprotein [Aquirufa ecclesiirivi]